MLRHARDVIGPSRADVRRSLLTAHAASPILSQPISFPLAHFRALASGITSPSVVPIPSMKAESVSSQPVLASMMYVASPQLDAKYGAEEVPLNPRDRISSTSQHELPYAFGGEKLSTSRDQPGQMPPT